jgi:haloalkane dehalogenase
VQETGQAAGRPLPDWLRRLYPFEPKAFTCGRARMSYLDEGRQTDEAVLLVHGNPTWSFYFRDLIQDLVAVGWRCVAPDHIGMGLSDKPRDYPYRLATHVENLDAIAASLGLRRVHLVVHDWGGPIGFGWAVRHPEKIGRIVILNTAAFPSPRIPLRINLCRTPLLGEWWIRSLNGFARPATRMAVHRRPMSADARCGYLFPYGSWAGRIGIARFVADIPMSKKHPSRATLEGIEVQLSRFRENRIMIGWGGADFCFNKQFYNRWLEIFPQSEAHYLADAGHYVLEDAREEIIPKIQAFLGSPGL